MKKLIKILAVLAVLAVVAVVAIYLSLGSIIKKGVAEAGPVITKSEMSVEKVEVALFDGKFAFQKFFLGNPEGFKSEFAFKVNSFNVMVDPGTVTSDTIHVKEIKIDGAELCFEGLTGDNQKQILANVNEFAGSLSTGDEAPAAEETPADKDAPQKKVIIDHAELTNTKVHLYLLGKKVTTLTLDSIVRKDIGKNDSNGTSMAEAFEEIYKAIFVGAGDAVGDSEEAKGGSFIKKIKSIF